MEKMLGVMLDCSRNAVNNVQTVKRFAQIIKKMGYNTLMLYTEETYEVNNQPYFGHLRGRYSKDELKELDLFCNEIGIELVPCIQTLAHLNAMFKWASEYDFVKDCDDILLAEDENTYKLIEDMISTVSECFTSKKIHIGMDEAYRVGTGKYQQIHGICDRFDVINNHLHKVCDITRKYGMEPMIWSDMFCKLALNIEDQYEKTDSSKILEKANLPEDITLVYWDYYSKDYDHYVEMIKTNKMFGRKVYFAGGAWTWRGFAPDNDFSLKTTKPALDACADVGIDGVFITEWGDDGSECSYFAVLPSLMYAAELSRGNTDINSIKAKFKEIVGCNFDDFMLLDNIDIHNGEDIKTSKMVLYNDLFMGIRDFMFSKEDSIHYKELAKELENIEQYGDFEYLFKNYEMLAKVLAIKVDLGVRTRKAYLDKNIEEMKSIIADYGLLEERLEEFYTVYRDMWCKENKPHGFDIQDIRIGGVFRRIKICKERLILFAEGKIDCIEELDEPVLDKPNGSGNWSRVVSPNVISHIF